MSKINTTIDYYNHNAAWYFKETVNVNMTECCERFLKYIVPGGRIIDMGAGSGRDTKYFKDHGYIVEAIDASEEMCRLASVYSGIEVRCKNICDWRPEKNYDGIWANASLVHMSIAEIERFIIKASNCLNLNGAFYISMKSGIHTGYDNNGRYFTEFSKEILQQIILKNMTFRIVETWNTEDSMCRDDFQWLNCILKKNFV